MPTTVVSTLPERPEFISGQRLSRQTFMGNDYAVTTTPTPLNTFQDFLWLR